MQSKNYWLKKIIEWESSGKMQTEFCRDNNIKLSTFKMNLASYRKNNRINNEKIKHAEDISPQVNFVEVKEDQAKDDHSKYPVLMIRTSYGSIIEVPL